MLTARASQLARASTMSAVEYIAWQIEEAKPKKAMDTGTIMHSLILENKLPEILVVLDYADYRTKSAQQERDGAYAVGKIPVLKKDVEQYLDLDFREVKRLFVGGEVEVPLSMNYKKGMAYITGHADWLNKNHLRDLKITNTQTFKDPVKEVYYRGYDLQLFLYMLMAYIKCGRVYNTSSIVFFNLDTMIFQEVDMHLEEIKESCIDRLENRAFQNIMAYEAYKNGMRQLDSLAYYPWK